MIEKYTPGKEPQGTTAQLNYGSQPDMYNPLKTLGRKEQKMS